MDLNLTPKMKSRIESIKDKRTKINFKTETFPLSILENLHGDRDVIPCLRSELRLEKHYFNVPLDLLKLSIRGADNNGEDCTIERFVAVNHNADLIFRPEDAGRINELLPDNNAFIDIYFGTNGRYKRRKKDLYGSGIPLTYSGLLNSEINRF